MSEMILPCPKCKAQRVHTAAEGPDINGVRRRTYTCTKCNLNTLRGRRGEIIPIEAGKPVAPAPAQPQVLETKPEGRICPRCKMADLPGDAVPVGFRISGLCKECRKEFWKRVEPILKEFGITEKVGEEMVRE